MKANILVLLLIVLLLAGCGGTDNDTGPDAAPTITPQPTLTVEERAEFPAGQVENPIRMVIVPADIVMQRVAAILTDNDILRRVNADTPLTDVLADDETFSIVNQALQRDFDVTLPDPEAVTTVDDLAGYIHNAVGERVSDTIFERTSLYVDLDFTDDYSDALTALCDSGTGIASIPWLNGITYQAAMEQSCGQPVLQIAVAENSTTDFDEDAAVQAEESVEAEATSEATPDVTAEATDDPAPATTPNRGTARTGEPGIIFTNADIGSTNPGVVVDRVFCRLGIGDFYSWFLPSLLLEQQGIDPLRAPSEIVDYPDAESLAEAVANGECALAGLSQSAYESLNTDGLALVETTIEFPYGILMMPVEVQLGVRLALQDDLIALAQEPAESRDLHLLLGQDALFPVELGDFDALETFFAGYDFVQLGS